MKVTLYERIKSNILYDAVKAYGITAKQFGENVQDQSSKGFEVPYRIHATDDSWESPEELIQRLAQDDEIMFKDEKIARDAVRKTFAEEIFHNPRIRQEVRQTYKMYTSINFVVTEKGRATIDNHSPYADIKYAINRDPVDLVTKPDVLLRMLEAEKLGLGVIVVETRDYNSWFESIFNCFKSDGSSDVSERWNKEREVVLRMAFKKLCSMVALNTKEDLRRECERLIANQVKRGLVNRIDQAPLQAFGFEFGSTANVLSITFGKGDFDSAVIGVYMRDNGKIVHTLKSNENPIRNRETEDVLKDGSLSNTITCLDQRSRMLLLCLVSMPTPRNFMTLFVILWQRTNLELVPLKMNTMIILLLFKLYGDKMKLLVCIKILKEPAKNSQINRHWLSMQLHWVDMYKIHCWNM